MKKRNVLLIAVATAFTMTSAMASPAGSWTGSLGLGYVNPTSDNGSLAKGAYDVDVDSNVRPTITGEYFFADNIGVEILGAVPFQHDIELKNSVGGKVDAETKHLPPTISLQYHFDDIGSMTGTGLSATPFVGVGLNYTYFYDEEIKSDVIRDLKIDNTFGVAGHIGVDFPISVTDAVRIDARYINIEPDVEAKVAGVKTDLGSVDINPWVYGISYVRQF